MVSVIIPTYNRAHYIRDAVTSVLEQTYRDFELIVVDDGSNDATEEVLRPYFGLLTYIYQENAGIAAARNAGISMSKGEFISFLDSDDLWLRNKLELQIPFLRAQPQFAMVYADWCTFDDDYDQLGVRRRVKPGFTNKPHGDVFVDLVMDCHISTVTVVLRRHVLSDVGLFDTSLTTGEDYDLWLRIAGRYRVGYLPKVVSLVRRHDSNITATQILPEPPGEIKAIAKALRMFPARMAALPPRRLQQRLSTIYFATGYAAFYTGRYAAARFHFRKAVMTAPFSLRPLLYLGLSLLAPNLAPRFIRQLHRHQGRP